MVTGGDTRAGLTGLTRAEVAERVAAGAVNVVPEGPSRSVSDIVKSNIITRFNIILGVLLVVVLVVAPPQDALFGLVLFTNSAIGIIQELRAKKTLDDLALLSAPKVLALRDGRNVEIAVPDVVADDLMFLRPGEQIVVDGVVVRSDSLEVDESLLTGESDPIMKDVGTEVLSGSFVSSGAGVFRATGVGTEAYAAKLADEAKRFALVRSELRKGIDWILAAIGWVMIPTSALLIWSQFNTNDDLEEAIRTSAAGMVAMIPQGLVLLTSVAFAVGVVRLGRRHVLVQELPAVEGLARVDVVCFDKTGTLTEGRLVVETLDLLTDHGDAQSALGALASSDENPNATLQAIGAAFAEPSGWYSTKKIPFSSARKWSGAAFGSLGTWVIGAPEMMLPDDPLVTTAVVDAAGSGRRVILLARSDQPFSGEVLPVDLTPIAMVGLSDRIREDAADTLKYFAAQGVQVKVISGDHPATVAAIAQAVGVPNADRVVDARHLPENDLDLIEVIENGTVFGRVTPHQKRAMVGALQARGHVVAMTGDGVNDVLALKDADIGIAMGSGSSATRSVAQLVLLDGSFATLPSVVAEGRRVIANIERVANLFVVKTVYAFLLAILVGAFARQFPFVPRHLTLVGTLTIGAPAFFLALAPNAARARPGFVARVLRFAVPVGAVAAIATYLAYELAISEKLPLLEARTLATLVLASIGLFALQINSRPMTPQRRMLIGAMAAVFAIVLLSPGWRTFFELAMPPLVVVLAGIGIIAITGAILYGTLQAGGWFKNMPDLLVSPLKGGPVKALQSGIESLRVRAQRFGEPSPPDE